MKSDDRRELTDGITTTVWSHSAFLTQVHVENRQKFFFKENPERVTIMVNNEKLLIESEIRKQDSHACCV